jgi:glycine/D-amino acid oxidase-like deaminating enzyme
MTESLVDRWGTPPWAIDFSPARGELPAEVDYAVVGAGFTGLCAAAYLKHLSTGSSVAVFDAGSIGSGASGRTGGITLAETAAGDLPGLGDVLGGLGSALRELHIDCDFHLTGAWELSREVLHADSPIAWQDSGTLCVAGETPGGTLHPGKLVAGLARAAEKMGVLIFEQHALHELRFQEPVVLAVGAAQVCARHVLLAMNAESLGLSDLAATTESKLTFAVATEPLTDSQVDALGLTSRRPFYTIDMPRPYLWGRITRQNALIFGSGLADAGPGGDLRSIETHAGEPKEILDRLERRIRNLHPALHAVNFTHRWGGPVLFTDGGWPVFRRHPKSGRVLVAAGYNGHGVALSVHLGRWAAQALLGRRQLPLLPAASSSAA